MVDPSREAIDKLLAIGSAAIFGEFRHEDDALLTPFPSLVNLLMRKNAFTAFESAMEVYGVHGSRGDSVELISWNFAPEAWRHSFSGLSDDWLFFAQDIYGMQFALQRSGKVSRFDPQTGSMEPLAPSLEDWAALILDDYRSLTGWPIAHEWQTKHGPLAAVGGSYPGRHSFWEATSRRLTFDVCQVGGRWNTMPASISRRVDLRMACRSIG